MNAELPVEKIIEALLFASDRSLSLAKIKEILSESKPSAQRTQIKNFSAATSLSTPGLPSPEGRGTGDPQGGEGPRDQAGEGGAWDDAGVASGSVAGVVSEIAPSEPEPSLEDQGFAEAILVDPEQMEAPNTIVEEPAVARDELDAEILVAIETLKIKYAQPGSPVTILEVAGGWQFATNLIYAPWIKKLFKDRTAFRLSQAALETLAIIGYRQPITRAEIEEIRGVEAIAALETLLERNLIRVAGRKETIGRPILYSTSMEFLRQFGLRSLEDLPELEKTVSSNE